MSDALAARADFASGLASRAGARALNYFHNRDSLEIETKNGALDLVSIQTSTRVQGTKVRRNKSITEINHYDPENDEINVQDVYQWQAETDEFLQMGA